MPNLAFAFGLLLAILGGALFGLSDPDHRSPTALIPSFFGIGLIVCGAIARNDKARMHAMHAAALIGLVGTVVPGFMAIRSLANGKALGLANGGQIAMAALCAAFVALCVKSFIDARRARKAKEAAA